MVRRFGIPITPLALVMYAPWGFGCKDELPSGKYAPPPLKTVSTAPTKAQEDFTRLRDLFKSYGGSPVTPSDRIVRWKDTKMFRLFELQDHSLVMFPHNWTSARFEVIVFAGHVKDYHDLFGSIFYKHETPPPGSDCPYVNRTMDLDPTKPGLDRVRFMDFYLGQRRQEAIDRQEAYLRSYWRGHPDQYKLRMDNMSRLSTGHSRGERVPVQFYIKWDDGRLAYADFHIKGMPLLRGYSISRPQCPVIDEGEFTLQAD